MDVVRDRTTLSRVVAGGAVENVYRLQIMNATETKQNYWLRVEGLRGLQGLRVASEDSFAVEAAQSRWVAVRVQAPFDAAAPGSHPIKFHIETLGGAAQVVEKSVFLVPR